MTRLVLWALAIPPPHSPTALSPLTCICQRGYILAFRLRSICLLLLLVFFRESIGTSLHGAGHRLRSSSGLRLSHVVLFSILIFLYRFLIRFSTYRLLSPLFAFALCDSFPLLCLLRSYTLGYSTAPQVSTQYYPLFSHRWAYSRRLVSVQFCPLASGTRTLVNTNIAFALLVCALGCHCRFP